MKYPARMSASLKVWHPTATIKELENAVGKRATISHEVGRLRTQGNGAPYRETYCNFDLFPTKSVDFGDLLAACAKKLQSKRSATKKVLAKRGSWLLAVKVSEREFVQLYIEHSQLVELAALGLSIVIE